MCVFCQVRIKVFTHKIGLAMQPRGSSSAGASPVTLLAFMLFILARHRSLHWNSKIAQQFLLFNISWRLIDMANCKCDCKRPQYKEQLLLRRPQLDGQASRQAANERIMHRHSLTPAASRSAAWPPC